MLSPPTGGEFALVDQASEQVRGRTCGLDFSRTGKRALASRRFKSVGRLAKDDFLART
jgi:hypothetical protein